MLYYETYKVKEGNSMKFIHPKVLVIGIIAAAAFFLLLHFIARKKTAYKGGVRAANTQFVKRLPEYSRLRRRHMILAIILEICMVGSVLSCLVLAARPYSEEKVYNGERRRDIFLCMDDGFYMDTLNSDLINEYEEIVRGAKGDRFGIVIFCSSSLVLVPLTDDYDFVIKNLEDLKDYFELGVKLDQLYGKYGVTAEAMPTEELRKGFEKDYARFEELNERFTYPTYINLHSKGAFLVGDGVASCLYSFPDLTEQERSRVIILSTDNSEQTGADPVVRLPEASELCRKYDVTMFALFRGKRAFDNSLKPNDAFITSVPSETDYSAARKELEKCAKTTGGKMYEYENGMTVDEILKDIQKQEAMKVKDVVITKTVDRPQVPLICLIIFMIGAVASGVRLKA